MRRMVLPLTVLNADSNSLSLVPFLATMYWYTLSGLKKLFESVGELIVLSKFGKGLGFSVFVGKEEEATSLASELRAVKLDKMSISSAVGKTKSPFLNTSNSLIRIAAFEGFISPISLPRIIRFVAFIIMSELGLLTREMALFSNSAFRVACLMMDDTLNIATAMSETSDWSSGFIVFCIAEWTSSVKGDVRDRYAESLKG